MTHEVKKNSKPLFLQRPPKNRGHPPEEAPLPQKKPKTQNAMHRTHIKGPPFPDQTAKKKTERKPQK